MQTAPVINCARHIHAGSQHPLVPHQVARAPRQGSQTRAKGRIQAFDEGGIEGATALTFILRGTQQPNQLTCAALGQATHLGDDASGRGLLVQLRKLGSDPAA